MQQIPVEPHKPGETSKIIFVSLFGLFFGLILVAFTLLAAVSFRLDLPTYLIYAFLLYLLAPIPPSLYIAQRKGDAREGQQTGLLVSITGIVLALLVAGIYLLAFTLGSSGHFFIPPSLILIWFLLLNMAGFLVSVLGASIGGQLGKAWRKRKKHSSSI